MFQFYVPPFSPQTQATKLMALDAGGTSSDPYCKVSLGKEKAKTKSISGTINPKWREGFDFYWYEDTGQVGAYVSMFPA